MTINEKIVHQPLWTGEELEIVYKYVYKLYDDMTLKELCKLLPKRTFCAVKNKVKQIKFGKYKKRRKNYA